MFYKVATPASYQELKRLMQTIAVDQEPTHTGQQIADAIVAAMTFPALNNRATWDPTKTKRHYESIAEKIDEEEDKLRCKREKFDPDRDWELDCGLMASLVDKFKAGNCDDLASYALDYGIRNFSDCVLAFTQHDTYQHSFVLVYCKGDDDVWLADAWVAEDRSIAFRKSIWCTEELNCRVMCAEVPEDDPGVIARWNEHPNSAQRRRPSCEYLRKEQTGKYTHRSACVRQTRGLG